MPWLERVRTLMKSVLRSDIPFVQQLVDYQMSSRGKMLRPLTVLLSARLAGEDNVDTIRSAAAIELMHNGTLLHDDVVDQSLIRHNRSTVNAKWNDKSSVLLGDYLLSQGMRLMTSVRNIDMLDSLMRCGEQLSEGELYQQRQAHLIADIMGSDRPATCPASLADEQSYYDIIDRKTASLFASCAFCGALSAGADASSAQAIEHLGRQMGLIFQMRDDILDYEPQNVGEIAKPVMHDVLEGKITLPLILAMRHATVEDTAAIVRVLRTMGSGERPSKAAVDGQQHGVISAEQKMVLDFVVANSGIEQARTVLERKTASLLDELKRLPVANREAVDEMSSLVSYAAARSK